MIVIIVVNIKSIQMFRDVNDFAQKLVYETFQ